MPSYSEILIIYNPISTGHARQKAKKMADRLRKRGLTVNLQTTEYSGHAEELAYQACLRSKNPLIISASGDGGYNEVVNGVVRAKVDHPPINPVCAILPAGNANDNRRSVRKLRPLSWSILNTEPELMDLLQLSVRKDRHTQIRYAHSYIGLGITSHAASLLNPENLGPFKEVLLVARSIFTYHPVAITNHDGRTKRYDSLVFANIPHMSKVLRFGKKGDINNGSFRVSALPHRSQFWLFRIILNLLLFIFGLKNLPQEAVYYFSVPQNEMVQLDGELMNLPGGTDATVSVCRALLPVIR
ncbi:MAG: acylglycerol kinase family protein [Candidatus Saccharibacteria bacterium]